MNTFLRWNLYTVYFITCADCKFALVELLHCLLERRADIQNKPELEEQTELNGRQSIYSNSKGVLLGSNNQPHKLIFSQKKKLAYC